MDYIAEPATDMSHTSDWPLPADSLRLPIPAALLEKLAVHPLSRDPTPPPWATTGAPATTA